MRTDKSQSVTFDRTPKNTMVFVNGEYKGTSPITMEVDASKKYDVTYLKKSYVTEKFTLQYSILPK